MEEKIQSQLKMMASTLDGLEEQANCEMLYCKLSDAVFWSDETPSLKADWPTEFSHIMRFLFRYRTSIILGEPDQRLREIHEKSKMFFPGWPGFLPNREATSDELLAFITMKRELFKTPNRAV